jgi:cyclic pyranopterin phosphate synthase
VSRALRREPAARGRETAALVEQGVAQRSERDGERGQPAPAAASGSAGVADAFARRLRDLRISVTDRCNFRCPYCMPAETFGPGFKFLPRKEVLTYEEIARLARVFVSLGTQKLRITGGEPLVRADLPELIEQLAAIPGVRDLALTTNGHLLERHAGSLARAGLKRVTVSLDSHDPAVFKQMSGGFSAPERVLRGIDAAAAAGIGPIKINCVVQRGVNDHTLVDLAERFRGTGHIVRFIEYMDVGTANGWELAQVVSAREIVARIAERFPLEPADPNYRGEVAKRWRYVDGAGEIGVIASVTQPFCGDCTRARLSAEGSLVTCLFATTGRDLKSPLRAGASDAELRELVAGTWRVRRDRYSEERTELAGQRGGSRIEMFKLGG